MRLNRLTVLCLCVTLLAMAAPTFAQDFRGRINGTVTDNTGAVLPGVTVTASSPALIQPQVMVTGSDGDFRFIALPPGTYDINFELAGFQATKREGVRVVINQTLTVDQQLNVATLQETVTVTGASPVVDSSTTQVGTNFTKELLTEIPNARDIWAAMAQAPGLQMSVVRRRRLAHRHADRLPVVWLRRSEPDQDGRHRHHRRHVGQRRLLRLRQLRRVLGRRFGQRRRHLRRRRQSVDHHQVGRRSLQRQLLQRLPRREHHRQQRAGCVHGRQPARRRWLLQLDGAAARQSGQQAVRHQLQRRRPALEAEGMVLL